jgi:hypothetical protein
MIGKSPVYGLSFVLCPHIEEGEYEEPYQATSPIPIPDSEEERADK